MCWFTHRAHDPEIVSSSLTRSITKMLLCISIKSKNKNSLNSFLKTIQKLYSIKEPKTSNSKRLLKRFTVLKSPHVNKTAQEQFELIIFSKDMLTEDPQAFKLLVVLKKLKKSLCSDVSMKLKFFVQRETSLKITPFNEIVKTIRPENSINVNQIRSTLVRLNHYGAYHL